MANEKLVYVVIVTFDGEQCIRACLDSVLASDYPVRAVVVDNNSADDTRKRVRAYENVTLLEMDSNLGFGRANNVGIRHALGRGADYVFLLNQDASVRSDTIRKLVAAAEENGDFGILSPIHYDGSGRELDPLFKSYVSSMAVEMVGRSHWDDPGEPCAVPFVNAAAWLVSAECLNRVGGFDPLFFMYGEDRDYCNRADFHGLKVGVVPGTAAYHRRAYAVPGAQAGRRTIRHEAARKRATVIVSLKHPSFHFMEHLCVAFFSLLAEVAQHVFRRQWKRLAVCGLGGISAGLRLPAIWLHRRRCIRGGSVWL